MNEPTHNTTPASSFATPRRLLRHAALSVLAQCGRLGGREKRVLARPRVQLLCLHQLPDSQKRSFHRLLTWLLQDHTVISYSQAVDRILRGDIDRPYAAVSFDDGFASCTRAATIMNELGVRACFFVCGSIVGETNAKKIDDFCTNRLRVRPAPFMSWADLELLIEQGHELGSHTMTHPRLAALSGDQIAHEVGQSLDLLRNRLGDVSHFAWPFGKFSDMTARSVRAVFDAGYRSCASAERGCHASACGDPRRLCLRRDNVEPGWPPHHCRYFLARNAAKALTGDGLWPEGWIETIAAPNQAP